MKISLFPVNLPVATPNFFKTLCFKRFSFPFSQSKRSSFKAKAMDKVTVSLTLLYLLFTKQDKKL
jgi:hypothetical protein